MPYGRRKTITRKRTQATRNSYGTRQKTRRTVKRYRRIRPYSSSTTRALRPKWFNPISQKQLVKFVYCDSSFSRTLNVAGSYSAYYVFRANSLFDPDYTGVGVQPYGFDQFCGTSMFNVYRVPASSIRIYFRPELTYASMRRLHAMIIPFVGAAPTLTDISDVRMIPYHKETTYDGTTESTRGAKMKHYMSTKTMIPVYSATNQGYSAAYDANPTYAWYWLVYFYTDEYDDEEIDIYFDVKIKYYSVLTRFTVPNES